MAVSPTQTDVFTAVVTVLNGFGLTSSTAGQSVPVIRGQVNRVPEPVESDFIVLWPLFRTRLATNEEMYDSTTQTVTEIQETQIQIQADVHGPASADNASLISTLFRSWVGYQAFLDAGGVAAPLYTSDPRQMPFENAEQQTEERWSLDLIMQADIAATVAQQSATSLGITTVLGEIVTLGFGAALTTDLGTSVTTDTGAVVQTV